MQIAGDHGRLAFAAVVDGHDAQRVVPRIQADHLAELVVRRLRAEILSGVRYGLTLGSPLALMIQNKDWANWTDVMAVESRDLPQVAQVEHSVDVVDLDLVDAEPID